MSICLKCGSQSKLNICPACMLCPEEKQQQHCWYDFATHICSDCKIIELHKQGVDYESIARQLWHNVHRTRYIIWVYTKYGFNDNAK